MPVMTPAMMGNGFLALGIFAGALAAFLAVVYGWGPVADVVRFLLQLGQYAANLSEPLGAQGVGESAALRLLDLIPPERFPHEFAHGAVFALDELFGPPCHLRRHGDGKDFRCACGHVGYYFA